MAKNTVTKNRGGKKVIFIIVGVVLFIALAGFGGYYFKQYSDLKNKPVTADQAAQSERERYIAEIEKLYELPEGEKPTVATVTNKAESIKQYGVFFNKAEKGDITLIYPQAKLAVLYRPSTQKLINVSTVTLQDTKPSVKIIGESRDRTAAEATINSALKDVVIIKDKTDAKGQHSGVIVVDISGKNAATAQKLAETLKGKVGALPEGEDKPQAVDIVIVAGSPTPSE